MASAEEIHAVAAVFDRVGAAATEAEVIALRDVDPAGTLASKFFHLLQGLDGRDVPTAMRDLGLFRFFVVNGLLQAQRLPHTLRSFVLRALGLGLREFAHYFSYLDDKAALPAYEGAEDDEKRFFAFCIAQLIEIGFEMDGLLMTMKGDALSQATAYELRRLREDGPDAFASSGMFTGEEKALWNAVFDRGGAPAIAALQRHFVQGYNVPFLAAPD